MSAPTLTRTTAAVTDDDGSLTLGTPFNNAWYQLFCNEIDSLASQLVPGGQVNVTDTGTKNDYAPGAGMVIRVNNASALTITGLVPNFPDEIRIIENIGSSTVTLTTDAGLASTASSRVLLPASAQWLGANGAIGLKYDATASRWRVLFVNPGAPITPAFNATDYTHATGGGTWTVDAGDVAQCSIQQNGKLLKFNLRLDSTSVGGTAGTLLKRVLPFGFVGTFSSSSACRVTDNSTALAGFWSISTGAVFFGRIDGANWSNASSNATSIFAAGMELEVN